MMTVSRHRFDLGKNIIMGAPLVLYYHTGIAETFYDNSF